MASWNEFYPVTNVTIACCVLVALSVVNRESKTFSFQWLSETHRPNVGGLKYVGPTQEMASAPTSWACFAWNKKS